MRRSLAVAAALALCAAPASAARHTAMTPATAPFAEAWARIPASVEGRRARKIAVVGVNEEIHGFNVAVLSVGFGAGGTSGASEATRGAFRQNSKGAWVKDLVTKAKATNTSLSYTISPNAFWYWGGRKVPVTYRDFVYTLEQLDDPNNDVVHGAGIGNLDPTRFTHKGAKQVTFFWRTTDCSADTPCGPYANWQSLFSGIPALYPSFALAGLDFDKIWTDCICGSDGKPVSDGPFYVANYTPGQGTTLRANPYWSGKKPGLDEVAFKLVLDPDLLLQAMRLGAIDAIAAPNAAYVLTLRGAPRVTIELSHQTFGYEHLEFREGKGSSNLLLRAPWMRQAIALAIDRQALIRSAFGAFARDVQPDDNLLFFPRQSGYRADFTRWGYNPRKALAILKAHCTAGTGPSVPDPANTKVWQCAGLPAIFGWTWTATNPARTTIEQLAKAQLKAIGIALVERPLPANVIFGPTGLPAGGFDIGELELITTGDPGDWTETWRCRGDQNWTGFCSEQVDALLRAGASELDPAKRQAVYQAADRLLAASVPAFPLYQPVGALVRKPDLLGIDPETLFASIENWHWKQ